MLLLYGTIHMANRYFVTQEEIRPREIHVAFRLGENLSSVPFTDKFVAYEGDEGEKAHRLARSVGARVAEYLHSPQRGVLIVRHERYQINTGSESLHTVGEGAVELSMRNPIEDLIRTALGKPNPDTAMQKLLERFSRRELEYLDGFRNGVPTCADIGFLNI